MKKIVIPIFLLAATAAVAQNKVSLSGLARLDEINAEVRSRGEAQPVIEAIVTMTDGWIDEGFEACGAEIVETITDNLLIVAVPADKVEAFANLPEVYYVEFGTTLTPQLDYARPASNVTAVQEGFTYNDADYRFDGTGVVTGLMDVGIDPNHANFLDAEGVSRVKQAYNYNNGTSATSKTAVKRFTTDSESETHGTHVAGIMAGSYNGPGTYCYVSGPAATGMQKLEGDIPYYGVATGSDIVMCGGALSETNILKGINAVIKYAESQKMPAVVNLSLGTNQGPHDGTSSLTAGINALGEKAIICISAGNDGDSNMFIGKEFTADDTELKTFLQSNQSSGIDIWTNGPEAVTVSISMFDATRRRLTEVATTTAAGQTASSSGSDLFAQYVTGSFTMRSDLNRLNNRYHVQITGSFKQKLSGQNVALIITGGEGQRVYVYGFGDLSTSFAKNGVSGYESGTTDGTISTMACGVNTIAVGSYNSRITWGTFTAARRYTDGRSVGGISPFSSFGTTYQGVDLPVICAPGAQIISSLNRYYTNNLATTTINSETTASTPGTTTTALTSYWGPMQGTSMSCPYTSGVVALWLQADPTLDVATIKEVMKESAIDPEAPSALQKKQWGGGRLDALAGLKLVLDGASAGIDGVLADIDRNLIVENTAKGVYDISLAGAASLKATLYNMAGRAVAAASAGGNELTLDASGAPAGVYVLAIESKTTRPVSRKIVIK